MSGADGDLDLYPQKVGIRSVGWNSTTLTINEVPMYLRGCGKHEDADVRRFLFILLCDGGKLTEGNKRSKKRVILVAGPCVGLRELDKGKG